MSFGKCRFSHFLCLQNLAIIVTQKRIAVHCLHKKFFVLDQGADRTWRTRGELSKKAKAYLVLDEVRKNGSFLTK